MRPDVAREATAVQRQAADPQSSVWVAASAGSGKTSVLTDRVLALLLSGTRPERILCLTFTRAAAAEMAQRINQRLSLWATEPDRDVRQQVADLLDTSPDEAQLDLARQLFARVLDVPGGLKILTLHSFCQSLLGRFPLEAGIAPHFEAIDERSAAELLIAARDTVLSEARADGPFADALAIVTEHIQEESFGELIALLARDRGRLRRFVDRCGGAAGVPGAVAQTLGVPADLRPEQVVAEACNAHQVDGEALAIAAEALLGGTEKTDQPRGHAIKGWLAADAEAKRSGFADYMSQFLTQEGTPRARLITKQAATPEAVSALDAEASRLLAVLERRRAAITMRASVALLQLGAALLDAYETAKAALARLDYDDLILKTIALLRENADAAWVLFKLDGGLDHILIDEAQDTNPDQWTVVEALAEEFFAGTGAREDTRTIFAVGDPKQSIFSFQRADPDAFAEMRRFFKQRIEDAGENWRDVELNWSFRSTGPVLSAVDTVFARDPAQDGVAQNGETIVHQAVRDGQAGLVEVWPLLGPRGEPDPKPWSPPTERADPDSPSGRLAVALASRIAAWIGAETLPSKGRPIRAGDIMILVRRRNSFVEDMVRALKALDIPVAGVDRMVLSEQIAVMDLIALGEFLLLPEDDLTLAVVLKGPLVGFDDDDLYTLAYDRGDATLWQRLSEMAASEPKFRTARDWLAELLAAADYTPPYELYARTLNHRTGGGESGRQRMVARLGIEAEDPIEEFLNLALAHERTEIPSLQNFLHWLKAGDATITRDLEHTGRDEVRIITVHGAKGLQAPIVILPDTTTAPTSSPPILWQDETPLWPPQRAHEPPICSAARGEANRRRDQEYRRLLYVAMTRAEDRLLLCGWHGKRQPSDSCWYKLVRDALEPGAAPFAFSDDPDWQGEGLRIDAPQQIPIPFSEEEDRPPPTPDAPDWLRVPPLPEPVPPRPLTPSHPSAEPPVQSPMDIDGTDRFKRGLLIHRLLQSLPARPAGERHTAAETYLARPVHGLEDAVQQDIASEVMGILESPEFAPLFAADSHAEVPIVGAVEGPDGPEMISGQVDRLVIRENEVIVVDYKTNRPAPRQENDVPDGYIRQMAAYRAVLRAVWPDRPIRCVLLWTDGPHTISLNEPQLDRFYGAS